jgi:UDP-3-O-[3-hydroxymyristoyl] glucosamine N-acyltransferase LpxD
MYAVGETFNRTCSIAYPVANSVTFARKVEYLTNVLEFQDPLMVIVSHQMLGHKFIDALPKNIILHPVDNIDYEFTIIHNKLNKLNFPKADIYGVNVAIHPTAVIGEGINVANGPDSKKIQIKHMGNVIFGDDVEVGALTLIERGVLDSTILEKGVKIDGRCTIGHNSSIGANTVIATGAVIGGSVHMGSNCWVGLNATIRNGISICDDVVVGMATCVTKDITESGVYAGVPAKFKMANKPGWNF